jgi:hypothetical protein
MVRYKLLFSFLAGQIFFLALSITSDNPVGSGMTNGKAKLHPPMARQGSW